MDFFERQDKARRNTKLLVFYFSLAVLSLILAVNIAVSLIFTGFTAANSIDEPSIGWSRSELLFWVTIGTLAVILIGSVFKSLQLARGGSARVLRALRVAGRARGLACRVPNGVGAAGGVVCGTGAA